MLHELLLKFGIYYAKRRYMPVGIDWLWDVQRINKFRPIRCIFDVGANEGQTALSLRKIFPEARIHSFEPVAATFGNLVRNVNALANVSCHNLALGSARGTASMAVSGNSLTSRLVPSSDAATGGIDLQSVAIETVDGFCREHAIERIEILKIDVEGAESAVLEGAAQMLLEGRIGFAFVEIGFIEADTGHSYAPGIIKLLNRSGMGLYAIYDHCHLLPPDYVRRGRLPVFGNALFVRE